MAIIQFDAKNRLRQHVAGYLVAIRSSKYLNNNIVQDHQHINHPIRSMHGFQCQATANITLAGIELVHMMRKQQGAFAGSLKQQFEALTA